MNQIQQNKDMEKLEYLNKNLFENEKKMHEKLNYLEQEILF